MYCTKCTLPLSRHLQSPSLDIKEDSDTVQDTQATQHTLPQDSEKLFSVLHKDIACTATQLEVDLIMPHIASRQMHRPNCDVNSTEEYCRESMYILLLDNVLTDLELLNECVTIPLLQYGIRFRGRTAATVLDGEMCISKEKWKRESKAGHPLPEIVLSVIDSCDIDLFPTIRCFLDILLTLPVSVAGVERSFSNLQLVKSWLRT
ncbi:hypothetical protein PR048_019574 [Dryococelus australis]|uniref:HAT C-terminal dimerisation domain-containing protein n=1 Tax=Dryococelus australis TaxID=614101 RepID=A0ABQ9H3U3_9NEOP|nr:hypothetical protein PR048_019574 [Dryococelus australis]